MFRSVNQYLERTSRAEFVHLLPSVFGGGAAIVVLLTIVQIVSKYYPTLAYLSSDIALACTLLVISAAAFHSALKIQRFSLKKPIPSPRVRKSWRLVVVHYQSTLEVRLPRALAFLMLALSARAAYLAINDHLLVVDGASFGRILLMTSTITMSGLVFGFITYRNWIRLLSELRFKFKGLKTIPETFLKELMWVFALAFLCLFLLRLLGVQYFPFVFIGLAVGTFGALYFTFVSSRKRLILKRFLWTNPVVLDEVTTDDTHAEPIFQNGTRAVRRVLEKLRHLCDKEAYRSAHSKSLRYIERKNLSELTPQELKELLVVHARSSSALGEAEDIEKAFMLAKNHGIRSSRLAYFHSRSLYESGDFDGSLSASEQALLHDPENAHLLLNQSLVSAGRKDWRAARRQLRKAGSLKPDCPVTDALCGLYLSLDKQCSRAEMEEEYPRFSLWIEDHNTRRLHLALYLTLTSLGKLETRKDSPRTWKAVSSLISDIRGFIHLKLRLYPSAFDELRSSISSNPANAWAYFHMGLLFETVSDPITAVSYYGKSYELSTQVGGVILRGLLEERGEIFSPQARRSRELSRTRLSVPLYFDPVVLALD